MTTRGRILLADDEPTFLQSTAELLRREGYEVDTVSDGDAALSSVRSGTYDLLISDLEMPGNEGLRLIRRVADEAGGLPIIILTGLPSTESAIASVELPVVAYLLKPIVLSDLLTRAGTAISRFRSFRVMRQTEERMKEWRKEFEQVAVNNPPAAMNGPPSVDAFLALTLRNVMGSITDLELLGHALTGGQVKEHPCQLMNCPRGAQMQLAIKETINVLEETKSTFKSKRLGELRKQLELLLEHV